MKTIFYFLVVVLFYGCTVLKQTPIEKENNKLLTQREMDLAGALEFIKLYNKDCNGDCSFRVSNKFKYIDNCLMKWDSTYFKSLGLNQNIVCSYPEQVFRLENFGNIFFTSDIESVDYFFSPFLHNSKRNLLEGQVLITGKTKVSFSIVILRNELYMSSDYHYPLDSCYW
ncbi:MAG: hypothetical protein P1U56_26655 [Saprospiraceae bacterium]|nr:hypothetical protein [Saprospiraceae bacterium]